MRDCLPDIAPDSRHAGETPLLWITGCTVGVAHPCSASIDRAQAWHELECACACASKWDSEGVAPMESEP